MGRSAACPRFWPPRPPKPAARQSARRAVATDAPSSAVAAAAAALPNLREPTILRGCARPALGRRRCLRVRGGPGATAVLLALARCSQRRGWDHTTPDSSLQLAAPFARTQPPLAARAATVRSGPLGAASARPPGCARHACARVRPSEIGTAQLLHPGAVLLARVPLGSLRHAAVCEPRRRSIARCILLLSPARAVSPPCVCPSRCAASFNHDRP